MEVPSTLVKRYLERRKREIEACQKGRTSDFESLERIGHQLKGNGSTFGFPDLSVLGCQLELAASKFDKEAAESTVKELSAWFQRKSS